MGSDTILLKRLCVALLVSRVKYTTPAPPCTWSTPGLGTTLFMTAAAVSGAFRKMTR